MIKFKYTILYVADVAQAISFYERTFQFRKKFITPENDYGELDTGDTTISFASHTLASKNITDGFIASDHSHPPLWYRTRHHDRYSRRTCSAGSA